WGAASEPEDSANTQGPLTTPTHFLPWRPPAMHFLRWPLALLLCFVCLVEPSPLVANERGKDASPRVRLAVVLMFDQLRGDYLSRWNKLFGEKGFRRLCDEGAWFQNCHYPYSNPITGPGHAS